MIVPHRDLSAAALSGVIEEYVTRDGTNLEEANEKAAAVRAALDTGELVIVYDAEAESCNILAADIGLEFLDHVQDPSAAAGPATNRSVRSKSNGTGS